VLAFFNHSKFLFFFGIFLKREWRQPSIYLKRYLNVSIMLFVFYFVRKVGIGHEIISVHGLKIDYAIFLISGLATFHLVRACLLGIHSSFTTLRSISLLPWIRTTPSSVNVLIAPLACVQVLTAFSEWLFVLILGALLFKTPFLAFFHPLVLLPLSLMCLAHLGLGMILASIIICFRSGRMLGNVFIRITFLLGSVFFPQSVLPPAFESLSYLLPIVPTLQVVRLVLAAPGASLEPHLFLLFTSTLFLVACGIFVYRKAIHYAFNRAYF